MVSFTTAPSGTNAYTIDRGVNRKATPRVLKFAFGDGYEQRALQGINSLDEEYSVSFRLRPKAEIDEIVQFFEFKQGITVFAFKPPHLNELINYSLGFNGTTREITGANFSTLNVPGTPERLVITNTSQNDGSYTVDFSGTNDNTQYTVIETLETDSDNNATIAAGIAVVAADWSVNYDYGDYWSLSAKLIKRYEP
jgi:phage-related protein